MLDARHVAAITLAMSVAGAAAAQGVVQSWVDRYDGTAEGIGGTDRGFAVSIDSQGNTIVGGFSFETQGGSYLAIKYAPDGSRSWVRASNAVPQGIGRTMTLDDADNVIIVGSANVGMAFGIVKLDSGGSELWSNVYVTDSGFVSRFEGVTTDSTGAIYAYGNQYSIATGDTAIYTVKYAADGTFLWDVVYGPQMSWGTGIAATDDGVYVVGSSEVASNDQDLLVLKITPIGNIAWAHTSGRTALFANDGAAGVAFDPSGNVVAAGTYSGNGNADFTSDIAVVRLAPDGTVLSEVTYDGPLGLYNVGDALVVDADGNAIVTGRQTDPDDPSGSSNIQTVKLDPMGNAMWERSFGGLAEFTEIARDMAIDHLGGVYIVGETWSDGPIREYFTIKYDAAGTLEWEQRYGGETYDPSYGMAIAVSADLRVSVTGYSGALGAFGDSDAATVCYAQPVAGDIDGDGVVGFQDLILLLAAWGPNPGHAADLDGDGVVGFADLLALLSAWSA